MRLSRRTEPFDSDDFIYELKIDGFRALAHLQDGRAELVSRNGNVFRGFRELATWIAEHLRVKSAVLDGEIVCLDEFGRSVFNDLLFRRGEPFFYAFDLLWLNGEDLRQLPLIERKARLQDIVPKHDSHVLYLDHIENDGVKLFESACAIDLEGIVAKRRESLYRAIAKPSASWIKIKNPTYSQAEGRQDMFEELALSRKVMFDSDMFSERARVVSSEPLLNKNYFFYDAVVWMMNGLKSVSRS